MSGYISESKLLNGAVQNVGASATGQVLSNTFKVSAAGSRYLRADVFVGVVAVTTGVTAGLEHDAGQYETWSTTKTVAITASTQNTFTAATTDICTDTAHGLSAGDPVVVSNAGGALPGGLSADTVYYVDPINANTFYLNSRKGDASSRVDITSTGSGTNSWTAVRKFSLTFLPQVTGDQAYLPLSPSARIYATTGASDSAQIVDIRVSQES